MALQPRPSTRADLAESAPEVGEYRLDLATDRWWWSAETYRIHGFEPGEVIPTTAMFLAHKHPEDRERVRELLTAAREDNKPFRSIHRIVDANGSERTIILIGAPERSASGRVTTLAGSFIDVTTAVQRAASVEASRSIAESARTRATIEQAKGALSVVFDIDPETAFGLLRACSNEANVPVRTLADWVLTFARRLLSDTPRRVDDMAQFLRAPTPI